jgi:hypothetical protein
VDKTPQRSTWPSGDKQEIVCEAAAAHLTPGSAPLLVDFIPDKIRQSTSGRLEQAEEEK